MDNYKFRLKVAFDLKKKVFFMIGKGLFGRCFDWDFDGKLDSFEQATDMAAFMLLMDDIKKSDGEDFEDESLDDNLFDDSDDDELY